MSVRSKKPRPKKGAKVQPAQTGNDAPRRRTPQRLLDILTVLLGAALVGGLAWLFLPSAGRDSSAEHRGALESANPIRDEAMNLADQIISDLSGGADALYARGIILNRFGNSVEALECWEKAVRISPDFAAPYYWIGADALRRGKFDTAVQNLRLCLRLQPELPDVRLTLAEALMKSGKLDDAILVLEKQLAVEPGSPLGHLQLGHARLRNEQPEKAALAYQRALELDPNCTNALYGIAQAQARMGNTEESRLFMAKFQKQKQTDFAADQERKRSTDDQVEARKGLASAYRFAAEIYELRNFTKTAENCWRKAVEYDPSDPAGTEGLAAFYRKHNRQDEAARVLRNSRGAETAASHHPGQ